MNLKYKEQTSDSLRLFVGENIFKQEDYTLVQRSSFSVDKLEVAFGILAESHFVTIKHPNFSLDEICICTDTNIANLEPYILAEHKSDDINISTEKYTYSFKVNHLRNGEAKMKREELDNKRRDLHTYHLEHVFPTLTTEQPQAMTGIYVSVGENIIIESIHTYPDEDTEVYTQTLISPKTTN